MLRRKREVAASAFMALLAASAALAQPDVDIDLDVVVELIAELEAIDGPNTVVIFDSQSSDWPEPPSGGLGRLQLSTDFCITSLTIDFPRVSGLRGDFSSLHYGRAVGQTTGNTLGVKPYIMVDSRLAIHGSADAQLPGGPDAAVTLSGLSNDLCPEPDGPGVYDIFVGLITRWDLTLPAEPRFAAPDTYSIPITVSIIP